MKICVIIPAAGRSRRFGSADKLAQDLGGRPLLMRTVELFTKREEVSSIIVAGPPDDLESFKSRFGATLGFHGAIIVEGAPTERWDTVKRALAHVPEGTTHVAVHDAARPATSSTMLDRIFEAAAGFDAVIPGLPVQETIKRVADETVDVTAGDDDAVADLILGDAGKVSFKALAVRETLDRRNVYAIQTPQMFNRNLLLRAYDRDDLPEIAATDDAALVEHLGVDVHVVEGDPRNLKVTTPDDLKLMRAILGVKPPADRPIHHRF